MSKSITFREIFSKKFIKSQLFYFSKYLPSLIKYLLTAVHKMNYWVQLGFVADRREGVTKVLRGDLIIGIEKCSVHKLLT